MSDQDRSAGFQTIVTDGLAPGRPSAIAGEPAAYRGPTHRVVVQRGPTWEDCVYLATIGLEAIPRAGEEVGLKVDGVPKVYPVEAVRHYEISGSNGGVALLVRDRDKETVDAIDAFVRANE